MDFAGGADTRIRCRLCASSFDVSHQTRALHCAAGAGQRLRRAVAHINQLLAQRDVIDKFAAQGADPAPWSPEHFAKVLRADIVKWAKVVKDSGATLD